MADDRVGNIREPMAGKKNIARPLQILGDWCRGERMVFPDAEPNAGAHVVERTRDMSLGGRHSSERFGSERAHNTTHFLTRKPARKIVRGPAARVSVGNLPRKRAGDRRIL